jgi:hypothetical protein
VEGCVEWGSLWPLSAHVCVGKMLDVRECLPKSAHIRCDTFLRSMRSLALRRSVNCICIEYIGVVSVVSQYNCVYYCDTCYIRLRRSVNCESRCMSVYMVYIKDTCCM